MATWAGGVSLVGTRLLSRDDDDGALPPSSCSRREKNHEGGGRGQWRGTKTTRAVVVGGEGRGHGERQGQYGGGCSHREQTMTTTTGRGGRTTDNVGKRETTTISRGNFGDECKFIYC